MIEKENSTQQLAKMNGAYQLELEVNYLEFEAFGNHFLD